jgi:hypothetical protein
MRRRVGAPAAPQAVAQEQVVAQRVVVWAELIRAALIVAA